MLKGFHSFSKIKFPEFSLTKLLVFLSWPVQCTMQVFVYFQGPYCKDKPTNMYNESNLFYSGKKYIKTAVGLPACTIQWNPGLTICQGNGKIISLNRDIVIAELPV